MFREKDLEQLRRAGFEPYCYKYIPEYPGQKVKYEKIDDVSSFLKENSNLSNEQESSYSLYYSFGVLPVLGVQVTNLSLLILDLQGYFTNES